MPVASNPLLQTPSLTQTTTANALLSSKAQDPTPSGADSFASVYSRQSQADYAQKAGAAQAYASKLADAAAANKSALSSQPAQVDMAQPAVADSGKDLPAPASQAADGNKVDSTQADNKQVDMGKDKNASAKADAASDKAQTADAAKDAKTDKADKDSKDAKTADAKAADSKSADAKAADDAASDATASADTQKPVDPKADPTALAAAAPVDPTATAAPATPAVDPGLVAMVTPPAAPAVTTAAKDSKDSKAGDDFDPSADPLADLPAVRMALEHNAKAQGTTSAHAADANQPAGTTAADDGSAAAGLTTLIQQQASAQGKGASTEQGLGTTGDSNTQGIKGGIGDAAGGTFADRMGALTQATAKPASSAAATPPASPLAMNQSGWTEGVVNRVMYLSSQNLKSADIQLSPAELGRLDIKVSMTADQQTQVTFTSAHVGVREALESQQSRLKDMFAQQGLGQMDVNVSDQSRNQQQQQQAQQSSSGSGGRLGRGESGDNSDASSATASAADVIHSTSVIGTSAVDYYA